ncbi:hypothetical protein SAMN04487969_119115 [Paenibacillus algorifonticola]|uniref:Uncharacterized protein n=1 Tax=Paenibacillus algorifonticola TaxID=684063 RepID=A0A1I2H3Y1_9BACL|nr:hypothetical protein SAMN04487969_119115 [Paenibacillus algorifonticola]
MVGLFFTFFILVVVMSFTVVFIARKKGSYNKLSSTQIAIIALSLCLIFVQNLIPFELNDFMNAAIILYFSSVILAVLTIFFTYFKNNKYAYICLITSCLLSVASIIFKML